MKIKKKLSGRALVVQLCSQELRVASMKLGSVPKLKTRVVRPLPEGAVEDGAILDPDALREALKSALTEPGIRHVRNVVFTLCSSQVLSETVAVRTVKSRRSSGSAEDRLMEKTLDTNRDMYFPVDTRGSRLVWTPVGILDDEDGSTSRSVQLWAVPNALVEEYYKLANSCGLKVLAVDYCGNSFTGLVRAGYAAPVPSGKKKGNKKTPSKGRKAPVTGAPAGEERPKETVLYLLPEEDFLLMTFVRDRQVTHQRLLNRGSSYMDELEDARMVLELYETEHSGGGDILVAVCGAGARDPEYVERVEEALNLPTTAQTGASADEWCLCAGAAVTRLDFGDPALNFPGRPNLLQKFWQYGLLLAGGGLLALTVLQFLGDSLDWSTTLNRKESALGNLQDSLADVSGFKQNWEDYEAYYFNYAADWRTLLGSDEEGSESVGALRTYNDNLSLMLSELEQILPDGVSVTEIGIAPEGLGLQIACEDKQTAAYVILTLRSLQYGEEPTYISDLTIGPGVSAFSVLSSLAQATGSPEAPPTEGSSNNSADVFEGSGLSSDDQSTLTEISEKLARGDTVSNREMESVKEILGDVRSDSKRIEIARAMCAGTNAGNTEITYSLDQVIRVSSVAQRKNGFKRMLGNPFALYLFAELVRADIESGNSTMRDDLEEFCWDHFDEDWFKAIFSARNLQAIAKGDYSSLTDASLTDMQTLLIQFIDDKYQADDEYYYRCEELVKSDPTLRGVLTYYICLEKGLPLTVSEGSETDPETGLDIDPLTGLLIDPDDDSLLFDKVNRLYVDKATNEYIYPSTGTLFDLSSGLYIDKKTKKLYDPQTGEDLDPATDMRMAKYTWPLRTQLEEQDRDISELDWSKIDWTPITWRTMSVDEVVDTLRRQAEKLLKVNVTIDPDTGLVVDSKTGLLYEPNTGLYIDPDTGRLVDADGKAVDPLTDSRLSQFMKYLPMVGQFTGLDTDAIDWTKIDWRKFDWSNLASMDNVMELIKQVKDLPSGDLPGFVVDPATGQLKYADTGELVDPSADPKLKELVGMLEQYLGVDLDNFNWGAIDWRDINIDNPGQADAAKLIQQIYANLNGQTPSAGFVVDPATGQLKYADTGELVDPSADPKLKELVGMLEQYLGVDLDNFNWGAIDWREINIDNPGQTDMYNLLQQIYANLNGQTPGGGGLPGIGDLPGGGEAVDTRIFFTVSIPYKESLIQAEMERKGLSRDEIREELDLEDYQ